jgi:hypothetical protein
MLYQHLSIYREKYDTCILFLSKKYLKNKKVAQIHKLSYFYLKVDIQIIFFPKK